MGGRRRLEAGEWTRCVAAKMGRGAHRLCPLCPFPQAASDLGKMPDSIAPSEVARRREAVRRLKDGRQVFTDEDAARYVDERGFTPLMHLSGSELPSISEADSRETWEGFDITDGAWRWKETLPGSRRCAYGKFLRHRGFFVSWAAFPAFYRLCGPADDSAGAEAFADGLLGRLEMLVLTTTADRGPIDSRRLWREVKQGFGGNRPRFEQALGALQAGFRVMVAGGDLTGWSLHRWDLVERLVPPGLLDDLPSRQAAQTMLLRQYVENTVVCTPREIAGFFRWDLKVTQALVDREVQAAQLSQVEVEGWKGIWLSTASLGKVFRIRPTEPATCGKTITDSLDSSD